MEKEIKKIIEQTPNDSELGNKIRRMYWSKNSINEVVSDPNQIDLEDMINEVENS